MRHFSRPISKLMAHYGANKICRVRTFPGRDDARHFGDFMDWILTSNQVDSSHLSSTYGNILHAILCTIHHLGNDRRYH